MMSERFKPTAIEAGLWKGADVAVAQRVIIDHHARVPTCPTQLS
jgi:acetyltransferase-like isoleucine patch superfamily enzyme